MRSDFVERVTLICSACAYIIMTGAAMHVFLFTTASWAFSQNRFETTFPTLLFLFAAIIIIEIFSLAIHEFVSGKIITIFLVLALGGLIVYLYLTPSKAFCIDFPAANVFAGLGGIATGLFAMFMNVLSLFTRGHPARPFPSRKLSNCVAVTLLACGGCVTGFATNWFDPYYHAVVPAEGDAPAMEFMFWSHINVSYFTASELQQLDRHGATIIAYTLANSSFNETFAWAEDIRDTYPRIKLMWPLFGGYLHREEIEGNVTMYLEAIDAHDLTNTIGFIFDLERHNDTCWHDEMEWKLLVDGLHRCFTAIKGFNASYRIDNTAGIWMMFSHMPLGGGDLVEVYKQHALMSLQDNWTGYQWQLYRGNAVDPASDPDSTNIYERMLSSVRFLGAEMTVPLFGMTGVGDYGANNCSLDSPASPPCNFAGVIKDCRLARSLGITSIGFFTLCDAGVYERVYYPSMFEAYGDDFLDVLNESVNGLDAPMRIDVPGNVAFMTTAGYAWEQASYGLPWTFIAFLLVVASCPPIVVAVKASMNGKNKEMKRNLNAPG